MTSLVVTIYFVDDTEKYQKPLIGILFIFIFFFVSYRFHIESLPYYTYTHLYVLRALRRTRDAAVLQNNRKRLKSHTDGR